MKSSAALAFSPTEAASPSTQPWAGRAQRMRRFLVRQSDRWDVVNASEVEWLESAGNYVVLHCGRDRHVVRETLIQLEQKLDPEDFVRISRSSMVRIDRIRSLVTGSNGSPEIVLRDGTHLALSRGVREMLSRIAGG